MGEGKKRKIVTLIDHVLTVSHADHEHVIDLLDTVELREELVDDAVTDTRATSRPRTTAKQKVRGMGNTRGKEHGYRSLQMASISSKMIM